MTTKHVPEAMTAEELNLLANVNEEASEVITELLTCLSLITKETMKAVRFGLRSQRGAVDGNPEHTDSPQSRLSMEIGQLDYMIKLLIDKDMVDTVPYREGYNKKKAAMESKKYVAPKIVNQEIV